MCSIPVPSTREAQHNGYVQVKDMYIIPVAHCAHRGQLGGVYKQQLVLNQHLETVNTINCLYKFDDLRLHHGFITELHEEELKGQCQTPGGPGHRRRHEDKG